MGVYVVKINELCSQCLYLPAVDIEGEEHRAMAVEINDLCKTCLYNGSKMAIRPLRTDEYDIKLQVQNSSPWLKKCGLVG